MPRKLVKFFSKRVAIRRLFLSLRKKFSTRYRSLYRALVIYSGISSIFTAGNDRYTSLIPNHINKIFTVIPLVCEHVAVLQIKHRDQISGRQVIAYLATRQMNLDWITQSIDYGMDLRGKSTSRTTNSLFFSPPFPPEPCWWTRTYDPSIIYSSLSWSFASSKDLFPDASFPAQSPMLS